LGPSSEDWAATAISLNPGLAIAYSNLGVVYVDTGRLDQARLAFMQATRLDDRLKAAWEGLARAAILAGDSDLGESALERTLLLDPNDAYAHWNLALLYARKPDSASRASSIAHARRAEALMPALRPDVEALLSQLSSGGTQQETEGQP
jgi:Flp pilus assembly protein TadD